MRFFCAAVLVAFPATMLAQSDFGNWLRSYEGNLTAFGNKPCIPSVFPFTIGSDTNLFTGYAGCEAGPPGSNQGSGDGFGQPGRGLSQGYLASIIPTPGLTPSTCSGTANVRCPSDASLSSFKGTGEALNQVAPGVGRAALSLPLPPLPTFRMLPFPPVFPNQTIPPPEPACDAAHDYPVLAVEHLNGRVEAIGGCSGKIIATIPVTDNPLEVAVLPDGTQAMVTSYDGAITFIDMATYKISATVGTPNSVNPSGIAISPDGTRAYVTDYNDPGGLLTIDVATHQIIRSIGLAGYPQSVFLTRDGSLAWVTFPFNDKIVVIDTLTNTIVKTLAADSPWGVAFNSTGTVAYVPSRSANAVEVFNTTTYATLPRIPVGNGPTEVGVAPDDSFALVTNYDGASLTVINLTNNATSTIAVPNSPQGLSIR